MRPCPLRSASQTPIFLLVSSPTPLLLEQPSDSSLLIEIVAFVVGGHETTSSSLSWCLLELAKNACVQAKLREDVLAFPSDEPSLDELNSLPYLDAVIREALRLHAAFPLSPRVAARDDVIPLKKSIIDKNGK